MRWSLLTPLLGVYVVAQLGCAVRIPDEATPLPSSHHGRKLNSKVLSAAKGLRRLVASGRYHSRRQDQDSRDSFLQTAATQQGHHALQGVAAVKKAAGSEGNHPAWMESRHEDEWHGWGASHLHGHGQFHPHGHVHGCGNGNDGGGGGGGHGHGGGH
eukprot:TRINITY_DN31162_c0_g1_i1.p1 TRINITY_DN31162_c0_g1~~TRINITY_DN31162_c0_g1_i1.p1  ORF type:complete len:157 (+),score=29.90 TRINITY_DN31162_c0_g1_i1:76-546(+)